MKYYNDFNYVNYILDLEFKEGLILYKKCLDRINDDVKENHKNNMFKLWLLELQNGHEGNFEDYYKVSQLENETHFMTDAKKQDEEKRIIDKVESKNNVKMKERSIL